MTAFLSRVQLNPARRAARGVMASPHAMHAGVLAAFPGPAKPNAEGRILWRSDPALGVVRLYVVSPDEPDFTHLIEQAGWPTLPTWQTRSYAELLDNLEEGQRWAFRLTANPTHSGRVGAPGADTKRIGHVTVAQQEQWLVARSSRAGFTVVGAQGEDPDVIVRDRKTLNFRREQSRVSLVVVTYEGRLEVRDVNAMRRTLLQGLGPAKAYGCGLLTLASVG